MPSKKIMYKLCIDIILHRIIHTNVHENAPQKLHSMTISVSDDSDSFSLVEETKVVEMI